MNMNYFERDKFGIYKARHQVGMGGNLGALPDLLGADTLIGTDVQNQRKEDLGEIKEIMLDTRTGRVSYAVLSFGGFMGMGGKLFAVPWSALTLDGLDKRFVLNVDKERLASAPGFDKNNWPDMADPAWVSSINDYYGVGKPAPDQLHS
jgi:hypothetical protein